MKSGQKIAALREKNKNFRSHQRTLKGPTEVPTLKPAPANDGKPPRIIRPPSLPVAIVRSRRKSAVRRHVHRVVSATSEEDDNDARDDKKVSVEDNPPRSLHRSRSIEQTTPGPSIGKSTLRSRQEGNTSLQPLKRGRKGRPISLKAFSKPPVKPATTKAQVLPTVNAGRPRVGRKPGPAKKSLRGQFKRKKASRLLRSSVTERRKSLRSHFQSLDALFNATTKTPRKARSTAPTLSNITTVGSPEDGSESANMIDTASCRDETSTEPCDLKRWKNFVVRLSPELPKQYLTPALLDGTPPPPCESEALHDEFGKTHSDQALSCDQSQSPINIATLSKMSPSPPTPNLTPSHRNSPEVRDIVPLCTSSSSSTNNTLAIMSNSNYSPAEDDAATPLQSPLLCVQSPDEEQVLPSTSTCETMGLSSTNGEKIHGNKQTSEKSFQRKESQDLESSPKLSPLTDNPNFQVLSSSQLIQTFSLPTFSSHNGEKIHGNIQTSEKSFQRKESQDLESSPKLSPLTDDPNFQVLSSSQLIQTFSLPTFSSHNGEKIHGNIQTSEKSFQQKESQDLESSPKLSPLTDDPNFQVLSSSQLIQTFSLPTFSSHNGEKIHGNIQTSEKSFQRKESQDLESSPKLSPLTDDPNFQVLSSSQLIQTFSSLPTFSSHNGEKINGNIQTSEKSFQQKESQDLESSPKLSPLTDDPNFQVLSSSQLIQTFSSLPTFSSHNGEKINGNIQTSEKSFQRKESQDLESSPKLSPLTDDPNFQVLSSSQLIQAFSSLPTFSVAPESTSSPDLLSVSPALTSCFKTDSTHQAALDETRNTPQKPISSAISPVPPSFATTQAIDLSLFNVKFSSHKVTVALSSTVNPPLQLMPLSTCNPPTAPHFSKSLAPLLSASFSTTTPSFYPPKTFDSTLTMAADHPPQPETFSFKNSWNLTSSSQQVVIDADDSKNNHNSRIQRLQDDNLDEYVDRAPSQSSLSSPYTVKNLSTVNLKSFKNSFLTSKTEAQTCCSTVNSIHPPCCTPALVVIPCSNMTWRTTGGLTPKVSSTGGKHQVCVDAGSIRSKHSSASNIAHLNNFKLIKMTSRGTSSELQHNSASRGQDSSVVPPPPLIAAGIDEQFSRLNNIGANKKVYFENASKQQRSAESTVVIDTASSYAIPSNCLTTNHHSESSAVFSNCRNHVQPPESSKRAHAAFDVIQNKFKSVPSIPSSLSNLPLYNSSSSITYSSSPNPQTFFSTLSSTSSSLTPFSSFHRRHIFPASSSCYEIEKSVHQTERVKSAVASNPDHNLMKSIPDDCSYAVPTYLNERFFAAHNAMSLQKSRVDHNQNRISAAYKPKLATLDSLKKAKYESSASSNKPRFMSQTKRIQSQLINNPSDFPGSFCSNAPTNGQPSGLHLTGSLQQTNGGLHYPLNGVPHTEPPHNLGGVSSLTKDDVQAVDLSSRSRNKNSEHRKQSKTFSSPGGKPDIRSGAAGQYGPPIRREAATAPSHDSRKQARLSVANRGLGADSCDVSTDSDRFSSPQQNKRSSSPTLSNSLHGRNSQTSAADSSRPTSSFIIDPGQNKLVDSWLFSFSDKKTKASSIHSSLLPDGNRIDKKLVSPRREKPPRSPPGSIRASAPLPAVSHGTSFQSSFAHLKDVLDDTSVQKHLSSAPGYSNHTSGLTPQSCTRVRKHFPQRFPLSLPANLPVRNPFGIASTDISSLYPYGQANPPAVSQPSPHRKLLRDDLINDKMIDLSSFGKYFPSQSRVSVPMTSPRSHPRGDVMQIPPSNKSLGFDLARIQASRSDRRNQQLVQAQLHGDLHDVAMTSLLPHDAQRSRIKERMPGKLPPGHADVVFSQSPKSVAQKPSKPGTASVEHQVFTTRPHRTNSLFSAPASASERHPSNSDHLPSLIESSRDRFRLHSSSSLKRKTKNSLSESPDSVPKRIKLNTVFPDVILSPERNLKSSNFPPFVTLSPRGSAKDFNSSPDILTHDLTQARFSSSAFVNNRTSFPVRNNSFSTDLLVSSNRQQSQRSGSSGIQVYPYRHSPADASSTFPLLYGDCVLPLHPHSLASQLPLSALSSQSSSSGCSHQDFSSDIAPSEHYLFHSPYSLPPSKLTAKP